VNPPGGLLCVRRGGGLRTALAAFILTGMAMARPAAAQLIRGTVRAQSSEAVVQGASITVTDSLDKQLFAVRSDDKGHFILPLSSNIPFRVTVRKIGWQPSSTDLIHASPTDTLDMDLAVPVDGVTLDTVDVNARKTPSFNETSYAEAKRLGWKLYEPSEIESRRYEFSDFENMLRALQVTGVQMPSTDAPHRGLRAGGQGSCYVNIRNGRCFTFVVDGQPVGTDWVINPVDVYFIAILQATQSSVQFGDKAPWGAILVVTRMNGDKKNP